MEKGRHLYALRTATDFVSVLTVAGQMDIRRVSGPKAIEQSCLYEWKEIAGLRTLLKTKGIAFKAIPAKVYSEVTHRFMNVD